MTKIHWNVWNLDKSDLVKQKQISDINIFARLVFFYRLVMQPHIEKGFSNGHIVIDILKDANAQDWPKIILDINNITIQADQGKLVFVISYLKSLR